MFPIGVDTFQRFNNNLEIIRVEELIRKAPLDRNITNTHLLVVNHNKHSCPILASDMDPILASDMDPKFHCITEEFYFRP